MEGFFLIRLTVGIGQYINILFDMVIQWSRILSWPIYGQLLLVGCEGIWTYV